MANSELRFGREQTVGGGPFLETSQFNHQIWGAQCWFLSCPFLTPAQTTHPDPPAIHLAVESPYRTSTEILDLQHQPNALIDMVSAGSATLPALRNGSLHPSLPKSRASRDQTLATSDIQ